MNEVAREYRRLLELRKAYHPAADIDWDRDPVVLGMVRALSADVDATVAFLGQCTADEFGWLSEVFAEVAEATRSQRLVDALYETAKRFPEACERLSIVDFIDEARDIVRRG